jgi:hypothetical protein
VVVVVVVAAAAADLLHGPGTATVITITEIVIMAATTTILAETTTHLLHHHLLAAATALLLGIRLLALRVADIPDTQVIPLAMVLRRVWALLQACLHRQERLALALHQDCREASMHSFNNTQVHHLHRRLPLAMLLLLHQVISPLLHLLLVLKPATII